MATNTARSLSLVFVGLALGPSLAHLLELPNKVGLSRDDYLTVQHIYNGWALLGVVVLGALASTLALSVLARGKPEFPHALAAFLCIAGAQAIFWTLTFPANQQTRNWTMLPEHWQALRTQWEYSHAFAAVLTLVAFFALVISTLKRA